MDCAEQQRLLNDESNAWAAYNHLKDSGGKDREELTRLYNNACDAGTRLRQHIVTCPVCQPKTDQTT